MQSPAPKIIIALAALIVVGGAALFVYSLRPQGISTDTGTPMGGNNFPVTQDTTYTQGKLHQKGTPEIQKAYVSLFESLQAKQVAFVNVDSGATGLAAGVYALFAKDIEIAKKLDSSVTDFSLSVALVDITGDDRPEALVYENFPGYCGSGGCALLAYQLVEKKWVKIFETVGAPQVGLSSTLTTGYLDLFVTASGDADHYSKVVRYVWDGKTYQPKQTVAFWNGTDFVAARLR